MKLAEKKCIPCEGGIPPFSNQQARKYLRSLKRGWRIEDDKLKKEYKFKSFVETMGFANQVALIAQANDHHPDMQISYSRIGIVLWTHASGGLTENDFILAAKIDQL